MSLLLSRLAQRAAECPESIVVEGADQNLTAAELDAAVRSVALTLREAGVNRLGLLAENSPAWIIVDLACQQADICLIPLPHFFSAQQLTNSMLAVGIDALLTDETRHVDIPGHGSMAPVRIGENFPMSLRKIDAAPVHPLPEGTRKVTFTSGTTGSPRGVCLDTAQQLRVALALSRAIGLDGARHLCLTPLSTLLENIGGVYVPLLTNGSVITLPGANVGLSGSSRLDMRTLLEAVQRHQPTSIILPPQVLVGLVAALQDGWSPPESLRFAAVGGSKVSPDLIRLARAGGLPVYEGYGLSETASVACLNCPGADLPGSAGRPLEHVKVAIDQGEITISGNTFLGYLDDPSSWYADVVRTGDLGRIDEQGYVHVDGRKKNVLISSYGRNINPEWLESQLLGHPAVAQCFAFGDARPWCVALIAPRDAAAPDREIQDWVDEVNATLPDYARVLAWHRLDKPLTTADGLITENGRPRRALIAQRYARIIDSLYPATEMAKEL